MLPHEPVIATSGSIVNHISSLPVLESSQHIYRSNSISQYSKLEFHPYYNLQELYYCCYWICFYGRDGWLFAMSKGAISNICSNLHTKCILVSNLCTKTGAWRAQQQRANIMGAYLKGLIPFTWPVLVLQRLSQLQSLGQPSL